jgi:hypothetical protein
MAMQEGAKVVGGTVDALRSQPLALALVIINVLFLLAGGLFVYYIGSAIRTERIESSALLKQAIENCRDMKP